MNIFFENYGRENRVFSKAILANISVVLELKDDGEHERYVEVFEREFAKYNHSKYAVALDSGTSALEIALAACGIGRGDEVILPAYTYIATALAVSNIQARPVFADIEEDTFTIDPGEIKRRITKKTKAVIPVHIHGNPCKMAPIVKLAEKYGLAVIEDAAHAHGAEYRGRKVGNFGVGCFSTHTSKNLSGIGNSGIITTDREKIYAFVKKAIKVKDDPCATLCKRTPCKMDAVQAAILKTKLIYLDEMNEMRRQNAFSYIQNLPSSVKAQKEEEGSRHVYRDFVIITDERDDLARYLKHKGIETKVRYKTPLHLTGFYRYLGYKLGDLPVTEKTMGRALWLPVSYAIPKADVDLICSLIRKFSESQQGKKIDGR